MQYIELTQGKRAMVDDEDYDYLKQWKWYAYANGRTYYARRNTLSREHESKRKTVLMHRDILSIPSGMEPDHVNHNGLDKRKANLRVCLHSQNIQGQQPQKNCESHYKGVFRHYGNWRARIRAGGKKTNLGTYALEIDAARAYDAKAKELFGKYAYLNLPIAVS